MRGNDAVKTAGKSAPALLAASGLFSGGRSRGENGDLQSADAEAQVSRDGRAAIENKTRDSVLRLRRIQRLLTFDAV